MKKIIHTADNQSLFLALNLSRTICQDQSIHAYSIGAHILFASEDNDYGFLYQDFYENDSIPEYVNYQTLSDFIILNEKYTSMVIIERFYFKKCMLNEYKNSNRMYVLLTDLRTLLNPDSQNVDTIQTFPLKALLGDLSA